MSEEMRPLRVVIASLIIGVVGGTLIVAVGLWAALFGVEEVEPPDRYVSFQENHSMDWDASEEKYLLQMATYKGGSVGDRAYNILVALNRVWDTSGEYPGTIEEVCELELPCGMPPEYTEEEWRLSEEAMKLILYERYDNSEGSLDYREVK